MSRVNRATSANLYPTHPITRRVNGEFCNTAYVNKDGDIVGKIAVSGEVVPLLIKGASLTKAGNLPKASDGFELVTVEVVFKKDYYNDDSEYRARSTEYRNRKDRIAIFGPGGVKLASVTAENAIRFDGNDKAVSHDEPGKPMSSTMYVYVYSVEHDVCFQLQLPGATGRNIFFDLRKEFANAPNTTERKLSNGDLAKYANSFEVKEGDEVKEVRNEYPVFIWGGNRAYTQEEIDARTAEREGWGDKPFKPAKIKPTYRVPVFHLAEATPGQLERADQYAEELDEYFEAHPDFGNHDEDETTAEEQGAKNAVAAARAEDTANFLLELDGQLTVGAARKIAEQKAVEQGDPSIIDAFEDEHGDKPDDGLICDLPF